MLKVKSLIFWQQELIDTCLVIYPKLDFPIALKKIFPRIYIKTVEFLDKFFKEDFEDKYNFIYRTEFKTFNNQLFKDDFYNMLNDSGPYIQQSTMMEYLKSDINYLGTIELSSMFFHYPKIIIESDFLNKDRHTLLINLARDNKIKVDLIKKRILELLSRCTEYNVAGYKILELPDTRIFTASIKGSPREGDLILFIPDYVLPSENSNSFSESKDAVVTYLKSFYDLLENKNCKSLKDQINNLIGHMQWDTTFSSFTEFSQYLVDTKSKKINISVFVDWPNVNQNTYGKQIDWQGVCELLKSDILEELRKQNISFTSIAFSSFKFFRYKPVSFLNTHFEHINSQDSLKVSEIVNHINCYYKKDFAVQEEIKGTTQSEEQQVDIEMLNQIHHVFHSTSPPDVLVLFSSDAHFLLGFPELNIHGINKLLNEGIKVYVVSWGSPSKTYTNAEMNSRSNFKLIILDRLIQFIQ